MTTAAHRAAPSNPTAPSRTGIVARIDRRLLVNFRVDPAALRWVLPDGLRPQVVDGSAVAGVCLLRMAGLRPAWVPRGIAWGAENAAHRIAVEWDAVDGVRRGVYIPKRYSASWVPVALGGRVMPGVHQHARFDVDEDGDRFRVGFDAADAEVDVDVERVPDHRWTSSVFRDVAEASAFFRAGSTGWSPGHRGGLEGLELHTDAWRVHAARAHRVHSSFIASLPRDSAEFSDVLLMQDVPVTWGTERWAAA
ncbi:DUF2071 domain-containing protein [Curtobacterium sp. 9128]|uniref:DUF2071 domain-containing protein n=1 Tax=Curtobacterium sp. 9128 TaxID=1793722 RepID=UPI0016433B80|nr:DUF2071 domain-containing protein [Curtobacterium sp. 9128]